MMAQAGESPLGANGLIFMPHLVGAGAPYWNPHARGVLFGLALGHQRKDLYRAVLEGVGFELRKNIEVFKELGIEPKELKLTGGGSRSDLWNQIYSDVLGITCVRNVIEEATSLGAAILAASGAGIFPDITKAAENLCKIDKKWNPNGDRHNSYEELYRFSCELYDLLENNGLYKKLNEISNKLEIK